MFERERASAVTLSAIVLEGRHVRLEPLSFNHLEDLSKVAFDPDIWTWTSERALSRDELRAYVERALAARATGSVLPFATIARSIGCVRVELRTDVRNERSRAAILRIGAKEEGILRKQMITSAGRPRDNVYFSILDDEWPEVKSRLEARMAHGAELLRSPAP
jgi:N-acetyltransferase